MKENRKFPRLDLYYEGKIDVPLFKGERASLPMLVTSVSPDGASVALSNIPRMPDTGSLVTVRFENDGYRFVLPMKVAWARQTGKRTELGLQMLLDQMPAEMAQLYARWIVHRFKDRGTPGGT